MQVFKIQLPSSMKPEPFFIDKNIRIGDFVIIQKNGADWQRGEVKERPGINHIKIKLFGNKEPISFTPHYGYPIRIKKVTTEV